MTAFGFDWVWFCCFAGQTWDGLYLQPSRTKAALGDYMQTFAVFSVLTHAPYITSCRKDYHASSTPAGKSRGWPNYFGDLRKKFPANYTGPFAVGVCWQKQITMLMVAVPCSELYPGYPETSPCLNLYPTCIVAELSSVLMEVHAINMCSQAVRSGCILCCIRGPSACFLLCCFCQ